MKKTADLSGFKKMALIRSLVMSDLANKLTNEQLGELLFRSRRMNRRLQKRFLHDCGGAGTSEELDLVISLARANKKAVAIAEELEAKRHEIASNVDKALESEVESFIGQLAEAMRQKGITQAELSTRCGIPQSMISQYLTLSREPGLRNLTRLVSALGMKIEVLEKSEKK